MAIEQALAPGYYGPGVARVILDFLTQWKYPVCVIYGNPDTGKSDTGVLIAEVGIKEGALDFFASNMKTKEGQKITSLAEVKHWHRKESGRKLYILDEAGINDDARNPMSKVNREIRHEIFIARKFKVHWVFIVQELKDVDTWKSSSLTGLMIEKDMANKNYYADMKLRWDEATPFFEFPRTAFYYDTLDIAPFSFDKRIDDEAVKLSGIPATVANYYGQGLNYNKVAAIMQQEQPGESWSREKVKENIKAFINQALRNNKT